MSTVGAVTVSYNSGDHLIRCVESLTNEGVDQIVVVDNGSKDDSLQKLADKFPSVPVIKLPNPGFGAANNVGVKALDTDVVFIINPDTVTQPGAIATLQKKLDSDPSIGIVAPEMTNPDGSRYPSARRFPSFVDGAGHALLGMFWKNNPWSRRYKMEDTPSQIEGPVDWVSGGAMFARREAFDSVGGFDPGYFMYMEDVDLCWRIRKAGWQIVYEPDASVMHVQGVSTRQRAYKMIRVHHWSLLRYHVSTAEGSKKLLLPVIVLGVGIRLPVALAHRYLVSKRVNPAS